MKRHSLLGCILTLYFLFLSMLAQAQEKPSTLFVLDGSGSMWGQVEGQAKITIAQSVMGDMLTKLPEDAQIGLMVYGHNRKDDCNDIEVVAPVGSEHKNVVKALNQVKPKGKTPLTESIRLAASQLRQHEGNASVVVVSDGEETCGGDPCAAAREASEMGVNLRIHVIGFDVTEKEREQLTCIAEKGRGKYFSAGNTEQLVTALAEVEREVVASTPQVKLAAAPNPANNLLFEDHFGRDELGEKWEVLEQDPNRLALANNELLIVATQRSKESLIPINLALLQEIFSGDFVASAKVTVPITSGIFAGIYYWVDDQHFLHVGPWGVEVNHFDSSSRGYGQRGGPGWNGWKVPIFNKTLDDKAKNLLEEKNMFVLRQEAIGERKLAGHSNDPETWYLQLERKGLNYTGRVSVDGVEWVDISTHMMVQKNGRLGLGAFQDWDSGHEQPAAFADFIVKGSK